MTRNVMTLADIEKAYGWRIQSLTPDQKRAIDVFVRSCAGLFMGEYPFDPGVLCGYAHLLMFHAVPRLFQQGIELKLLRSALADAIQEKVPPLDMVPPPPVFPAWDDSGQPQAPKPAPGTPTTPEGLQIRMRNAARVRGRLLAAIDELLTEPDDGDLDEPPLEAKS